MKTILRFALILSLLFLQNQLLANTIVVKGTIKNTANQPIANKKVKIYSVDSTNGGCVMVQYTMTNPNGYYIDTLSCSGEIRKLMIFVENCDGTMLTRDPAVGISNLVEVNFVICTPGTSTASCKAKFSFATQGRTVKFNSSLSAAAAGDSIISRTWKFSDTSTSLTGNRFDPSFTYGKAGKYTVCLYIKTKNGCENKFCAEIEIKDSINHCKAYFTWERKDSLIVFNSAGAKGISDADSIISRTWYYADSSTSVSLGGNVIAPSYPYSKPGTYKVYLVIKTKSGCESKYGAAVTIPPTANCKAYFNWTRKDSLIVFNSADSRGATERDSIISRTWSYTDSSKTLSLGGNIIAPSYPYTKPGTYKVYLVIKTRSGCENKFGASVVILPPAPPSGCKALFTYSKQNGEVKFNSNGSRGTTEKDSVISRVWFFGDSTVPMEGNHINPSHSYTKPGKYLVKLYIKTQSGCESKYSETITIGNPDCRAEAQFTAERISLKKIAYNSSLSKALPGDSIIQRTWKFGDNTILSGNEINPVKEFAQTGLYTSCLYIKTLNGCEAKICREIVVKDTVTTPQANVDYIKIIQLNPNPVVTRMMATIYSRNNNAETEITVFDIYGTAKFRLKKLLQQGNNMIEIGCESLYHGPYFLKVTSKNGRDSKAFYKL